MDGASRLIYMFTLREGAAIKGSHSVAFVSVDVCRWR